MNTIIRTKKGLLEGVNAGAYTVYKGVPYAKPPTGELRFQGAAGAGCLGRSKKADTFPNMCEQELPTPDSTFTAAYYKEFYSNPDFVPPMSEDCLYLNIWVPNQKSAEPMPVAFDSRGGIQRRIQQRTGIRRSKIL